MVRLKHRYLLIDILYPSRDGAKSKKAGGADEINHFLAFHAPSPSRLDEKTLARLIRENVSELFGDYGAGKIASSLKGKDFATCMYERIYWLTEQSS